MGVLMVKDPAFFEALRNGAELSTRAIENLMGIPQASWSKTLYQNRKMQPRERDWVCAYFKLPKDLIESKAGMSDFESKRIRVVGTVKRDWEITRTVKEPKLLDRDVVNAAGSTALRIDAGGTPVDKWLVFFVPPPKKRPQTDRPIGRWCVIRIASGGSRLGILRRGNVDGLYNIEGLDGRTIQNDVMVASAAPVLWARC